MTGARIDQLLAAAHAGDATGDAALALAARLRAAGHEADVFASTVDEELSEQVRSIDELPPSSSSDTTILHFNIPSPLNDVLVSRRGRRVIVYHNLTPPELLLPHCPEIARLTALGRRQLHDLAASGAVDLAIGVSRYNTADLDETGFGTTTTLPLPIDLTGLRGPTNPVLEADLAHTRAPTFLTVGRVAPNKRIEDFIRIAAYYLRYVSPEARFLIVGGTHGLESYLDVLIELHGELRLDGRVAFTGKVSPLDLITYYRNATAYVCTSAHEGFCAPLLEAMAAGVPIVARPATAIPETLGSAGVLVDSDDPAAWAELLGLIAEDPELRASLAAAGRRRVRDFDTDAVLDLWLAALANGAGA